MLGGAVNLFPPGCSRAYTKQQAVRTKPTQTTSFLFYFKLFIHINFSFIAPTACAQMCSASGLVCVYVGGWGLRLYVGSYLHMLFLQIICLKVCYAYRF